MKLKVKPWITKEILTSIRTKNILYRKLCKSKFQNNDLLNKYKTLRNKLNRMKNQSKKKYYHRQIQLSGNDRKKTWRTINNIIGKRKSSTNLPSKLIIDGIVFQKPVEIIEQLNNHFSTVGQHSDFSAIDFDFISKTLPNIKNTFFFEESTAGEITQIINKLDSNKSNGPDEISVKFLKRNKFVLSPMISKLINESFNMGVYPTCLKTAKVIPLFKGGTQTNPSNFRPISLLSNINKIFEKAIHSRLSKFFEKFNILNDCQFGFRKGHSTTMAITEFIENILKSSDNNKATCAILLDLSKVFDSVDRGILLTKLHRYGIRGKMLDLLKSYLSNRTQFIHCDGLRSSEALVNTGVPQGSILGPLLFLIHLNDFKHSTKLSLLNFADDTLLYHTVETCEGVQQHLDNEMNKINTWMEKNRLKLNASKTKFMIFSPNIGKFKPLDNLKLCIGNVNNIEQVDHFKYLGLIIDKKLNWKLHVNYLNKKLSKTLGLLFKIRYYLDKKTTLLILHSLFLSHIQYGILCWGRCCKSTMKPISTLYNRALRCINFSHYKTNSNSLYKKEKLLKVDDIFMMELSKFMFKFGLGLLPRIFHDYFRCTNKIHAYNTRGSHSNYYIERKKSNKGMCALNFLGPRVWHDIPIVIKSSKSTSSFCNALKKYILKTYD